MFARTAAAVLMVVCVVVASFCLSYGSNVAVSLRGTFDDAFGVSFVAWLTRAIAEPSSTTKSAQRTCACLSGVLYEAHSHHQRAGNILAKNLGTSHASCSAILIPCCEKFTPFMALINGDAFSAQHWHGHNNANSYWRWVRSNLNAPFAAVPLNGLAATWRRASAAAGFVRISPADSG